MNQSQQHKIGLISGSIGVAVVLVTLLSVGVKAADNESQVLISSVVVTRSNIFDANAVSSEDPKQQATQLIASGVNRFHKTTLESVILREIGISPGDTISVADVAEVERRLRDLDIFASVGAKLVTVADGVELHIDSRDNFSIVAGATGSFLGGVGNIGFTVGEKNVLGTGNELKFGVSRSTSDSFRGSVAFTDLHFFERPWQAEYSIGRTNEGDFYGVELSESFRSLGSGRAWSVKLDYLEYFRKYYLDGSNVFQVPEDRSRLIAKHVWRSGDSGRFFRKGLEASLLQSDYSTPAGSFGDLVQPEDTRTIYFGGLLGSDQVRSFKKVLGLDTLNFVQDIRLGSTAEIELGVNLVEDINTLEDSRVDPKVSVLLDNASEAGKHTLLRMTLGGNAVFEETGERPWNATARVRAYNTAIKNTTVAFNADYSTGEDGSGLPLQLTLGENNGLRGYDLRQFQGRQRLRMNIEGRYNVGWKLSILDVGIVGFADAGWAAPKADSSVFLARSIGAGLRLASNSILGSRVIRIDLAFPLDAPEGDSSDPSLSAAVGQVFRF